VVNFYIAYPHFKPVDRVVSAQECPTTGGRGSTGTVGDTRLSSLNNPSTCPVSSFESGAGNNVTRRKMPFNLSRNLTKESIERLSRFSRCAAIDYVECEKEVPVANSL